MKTPTIRIRARANKSEWLDDFVAGLVGHVDSLERLGITEVFSSSGNEYSQSVNVDLPYAEVEPEWKENGYTTRSGEVSLPKQPDYRWVAITADSQERAPLAALGSLLLQAGFIIDWQCNAFFKRFTGGGKFRQMFHVRPNS